MLYYIFTFIFTYFALIFVKPSYNRYYISCLSNASTKQTRNLHFKYIICLILVSLFFSILGGIRYDVGTDYMYTYYPNFYKILAGSKEYSEFGFYLINKFIQLFTTDVTWLFILTSFLYSILILNVIIKYSKNYFVSMVVLFLSCIYFFSLNNVRQAIAAAILLNGIPYIIEKKFIKFLILILLASIFHYSCVVLIPVYFFINFKFIKKNYMIIILSIILLSKPLSDLLILILSHTKYAYFFNSHYANGKVTYVNIIYGAILLLISVVILYKRRLTDNFAWLLLCVQFFNFWMYFLSFYIPVSEMISRIAYYFWIYQIILIPYLISVKKKNEIKIILFGGYTIIYFVYFYYYIIMQGYYKVLPYQSIFSK